MAKSFYPGQTHSPRSDPAALSTNSSQDYARFGTSTASSYDYFAGPSSASLGPDGLKYEPSVPPLGLKTVMPAYLLNFFACGKQD